MQIFFWALLKKKKIGPYEMGALGIGLTCLVVGPALNGTVEWHSKETLTG
jgi:hypothetical protein